MKRAFLFRILLALMIFTKTGIIVITGCAHPGIVHILKIAKDLLEDKIQLAMGGFHLGTESKSRVEEIINDQKVEC